MKFVIYYNSENTLLARSVLEYDGRGNIVSSSHDIIYEGKKIGTHSLATVYDCMSQKIRETEQNHKITRYSYSLGRLQEIIDPNNIVLSHFYDSLGRLKNLVSSDGTIDYRYTYDLNDNVLCVEDVIHQTKTQRAYDCYNRLIYEKQATGKEVNYSYDELDRLQECSLVNRNIKYTYDPAFLTGAKCYKSNQLIYEYQQSNDWRGKLRLSRCPFDFAISYDRDSMGRCTGIDSDLYQQRIVYDTVGNIKWISIKNSTESYETDYKYDDLDQLIAEEGTVSNQYDFDSLHNRRIKNNVIYKISDLNQIIEDDFHCYIYDSNGRRIKKDSECYSYDALGRLIQYVHGDHIVNYLYDPFGRLMEQGSDHQKIQYLYQYDTEVAAFKNDQMISFKAIYSLHAPFAIELNDHTYGVIRNHRGDVTLLFEKNDVAAYYHYTAFGEFIHHGEIRSPWLFAAQRFDENIRTFLFAKRMYDPKLGVWLTPDPLGMIDGPNLYSYVNNNPLTYVDPYGLWKEECETVGYHVKEFSRGTSRGFIDTASFGASDYLLGEHQHSSFSNRMGYYTGAAGSLAAGCFYGSTWAKSTYTGAMASLKAYNRMKTSLFCCKELEKINITNQMIQIAKNSKPITLKIKNIILLDNTSVSAKNITKNSFLNFTISSQKHMNEQERKIPIHLIKKIIENPVAVLKDPKKSSDAIMYYSQMWRNNKLYNTEVLYNENTNTVLHFRYTKSAIGPLKKITKEL